MQALFCFFFSKSSPPLSFLILLTSKTWRLRLNFSYFFSFLLLFYFSPSGFLCFCRTPLSSYPICRTKTTLPSGNLNFYIHQSSLQSFLEDYEHFTNEVLSRGQEWVAFLASIGFCLLYSRCLYNYRDLFPFCWRLQILPNVYPSVLPEHLSLPV